MAVFWVMAPCRLVEVYQRFRNSYCLRHQGISTPHNQPTKKSTGGVKRKREISSVARLDHSCVQSERIVINGERRGGGVSKLTRFCHGGETWLFKQAAIAAGGKLSHQATSFLWKRIWLNSFLGVDPRSTGIALVYGLGDLGGGITFAEDLRDWGAGPCPFPIIPWHLPYNRGKARKTSARVAE
jgi:hypothetical protein